MCRVTSDEGDLGRGHLGRFQDVDTTTPTILTTSQLLTTGVDAPTCKNIVLARVIGSMCEFKQIIGRGTRVRDDYGKLWFSILDYAGEKVRSLFPDVKALRRQWADPAARAVIIQSLAERGIGFDELADASGLPEADPFDLLCQMNLLLHGLNAPRIAPANALGEKLTWYYEQPLPEGRKNYTKTQPIQFEEFADCLKWWGKRKENERAWKVPAKELLANGCNLDRKNPNAKEDITHLPPEELAASILEKERRIADIVAGIQKLLKP